MAPIMVSRHRSASVHSRRLKLLFGEPLEQRQLLASDFGVWTSNYATKSESLHSSKALSTLEAGLVQAAPTHVYFADGQPVSMVVNPTRLALKLADGVDESALDAWGLQHARALAGGYSVYASVNETTIDRLQLESSGLIAGAVSVFFVQESRSEAVVLDEIIVALKPGVTAAEYFQDNPLFSSYERLMGTPDQFIARVADGQGELALHVANAIDEDPRLQFTAPNFYQNWQRYFIPNDPRFTNLWHLDNTGQGGGLVDADVDMPEAWDVNPGGSSSLVIGVVDDGVSAHPDLNLWENPGELPEGLDNDGNGWIDDMSGWNFVFNNSSSNAVATEDAHGVAVAGVAAARGNNALGVAGASYNSRVLSAKIFQGTSVASDANIAGALYYAAGRTADGLGTWKAADIVNNSWGGGANSTAINAALTWGTTNGNQGKGVAILFATGNGFGAVSQPALQSLNIPGVFAIGATNNKGTRSDYSNFGPAVDMVTPSDDTRSGYLYIDTTDRVGTDGYAAGDYTGTGSTTGFGGTSSATPLATGIAALVLAQANAQSVVLTPAQLRSYLRMNTDLIGGVTYNAVTARNDEFGFGRLNAASAVSNLGKPEISVLSTTTEVQSGGVLNLGSVWVDESSDQVIRIRNQGTLPLNLGTITLGSGPFSLVSGPASSTLALGEFTTLTVRFTPTAGGVATTLLTINSNDSSEAVFSVTLSAVGLAPNISGFVFEDWDGDHVLETPDLRRTNQTVFLDTNSNGSFDQFPNSFVNTTATPLVDSGTATSTIAVSGLSSVVADVNLRINLTHTYVSDLRITLISPTGTSVILANEVGGSGDNMTNTVFDDEATTAIGSGAAPFTGSFRPTQSLNAFDNGIGNGTWTLQIDDLFDVDTGSLIEWELVIATAEPFAVTRANGAYGFLDVPNGAHVVRAIAPTGWAVAGNTSYNVNVTAPSDMIRNQNFGMGQNDRFYSLVFNDFDVDGIWDNTESGLGSAVLFGDANANGLLDGATSSFSVSPALSIPDLSTRTSTVSASGLSSPIIDVNVKVNFTMTFDGDLDVFLIAPDGTRVELFTDVGGGGDNFTDTILDDQAATAITAGTAPFTGSFRPEGSLAVLNGKDGNGTWTLEVSDDAGGDVATLNSWDVTIATGETMFHTSIASGIGAFALATGSHNVQIAPPPGFRYTLPANGLRVTAVTGVPLFDQRYGLRPLNTAPTDISLSANTVQENLAAATVVGTFSSTDADFGNTFTYTLVTGAGDSGNGQFTIDGSGTLKTAATFNFEAVASYSIRVRSTDQDGQFFEESMVINVGDILEMSGSVVVGTGTAQRSLVNKLEMTFDGATTFEAGAFTVDKRGAGGGVVTTSLATVTNGSGQTVATLTFSGAFTRGATGALSDGYYQLTMDGSKIRRGSQTADLNGDGVGGDTLVIGAAEADNFFALFGDTSGDGLVGIAEFGQFRSTFGKLAADPGYNAQFDFDADSAVGISDFGQFRSRFGKPKLAFS